MPISNLHIYIIIYLFLSPKKMQSPMQIGHLGGAISNIIFLELMHHNVKDLVGSQDQVQSPMMKASCINVSIHTHGFRDIYVFFKFIKLMFLSHHFCQVFFHKSSLNIKLQTFFWSLFIL